jgi:hypothetical protein
MAHLETPCHTHISQSFPDSHAVFTQNTSKETHPQIPAQKQTPEMPDDIESGCRLYPRSG